jgi:hypothetical protein
VAGACFIPLLSVVTTTADYRQFFNTQISLSTAYPSIYVPNLPFNLAWMRILCGTRAHTTGSLLHCCAYACAGTAA